MQDGPKPVEPGTCSTPFALGAASPSIRRVRVVMSTYNPSPAVVERVGSGPVAVDDIAYEAPQVPIDTPTVAIRIPYLVGQTFDSARAVLAGLNLRLGTVRKVSANDRHDVVSRQQPDSGTPASPGDSVNVDVDSVPPALSDRAPGDRATEEELARRGISVRVVRDPGTQRLTPPQSPQERTND
jgi:hypothetical protein